MAWIESHQELGAHPKTRKLAALLGIHRMQAVGHLHALWWWALDYADDGNLSRFDADDIALGAEWEGDPDKFVDALKQCGHGGHSGFIDEDDWLHDWDVYAGKLVDRRRADRERKRTSRATPKDVQRTSGGRGADIRGAAYVPNPTQPNQPPPSKSTADVPSSPPGFDEFWANYPKRVGKQEAIKAWPKARKLASIERIVAGAKSYRDDPARKPDYTANPATWLNAGRWEDETVVASSGWNER